MARKFTESISSLVFTGRERTGVNRNYYNSHLCKPALIAPGSRPLTVLST